MDREKRSRLRNVVTQARNLMESDTRAQLRRLGLNDDGSIRPLWELRFLSRDELKLRGKILPAIQKERAGDISPQEALDRYVRHVGFTFINRIAALRAMEVWGLIKETILRRTKYGDRSRREYEIAEKHRERSPEELLKFSLLEAFREVSEEIKVLFDTNDEYSLLFPELLTLRKLIEFFSKVIPEENWKEDDIIGWIYQYYNEEARAKFKKEKRKPKADDIPVINQFYTPRWVVRVLVDNALGRLWLEMNGRCPKLGDAIERTKEQMGNPYGDIVDEFCSYMVPLSQEPPPRKSKRVREIKVLDPACGSGHFLVYAFDVLFRMYREDEPGTSVTEIPRLILENNLFGIDIDLRAVQLAALSLYLKAKRYNPSLKITKMNLVCADARITDGEVRKIFLERFSDDPELQRIFTKIFEDLEYTYEIGSLLKVREPFERFLKRRREKGMQAILFPRIAGQTLMSKSGKIEGQTELAMSVSDEVEGQETTTISRAITHDQMIGALKDFEKEAMERRDMGTLLFATEAEKSVGLLALLTEKYDVVLMNPAYGSAGTMPSRTKDYIEEYYPRTKNDYYASFIEQAVDLVETNGFVGMLTSRTFMFLKSFLKLRTQILWDEGVPELLLDNGFGVLDGATVETAATVLRKIKEMPSMGPIEKRECTFCRLAAFGTYEKERIFMKSLIIYLERGRNDLWYRAAFGDLKNVPGSAYGYWASPMLRMLFTKYPPLDRDVIKKREVKKIADAKVGLQTGDDARFTRQFWEVPPNRLGKGKKWIPYVDGGGYQKFYADVSRVVNWENEGKEIRNHVDERGRQRSRPQNVDFYFREGLTWTKKPSPNKSYFPSRVLVGNSIFTVYGLGCFPVNKNHKWGILGVMCSGLSYFLLSLYASEHNWEVSHVSAFPVSLNAMRSAALSALSQESYSLRREWDTGNEVSTIFVEPWMLQAFHAFNPEDKPHTGHPFAERFSWADWNSLENIRSIVGTKKMNLRELGNSAIEREKLMLKRLEELQRLIDEEVYRIYKISEEDKRLIEKELALRHGEFSFSRDEGQERVEGQTETSLDVEAKLTEHGARLISFYIKRILEADTDGIIPLHHLVEEIRNYLAKDFGEDHLSIKEKEIEEILGKNLEDWVAADYFDFHVDLYKRRPIFWHLTSVNFATGRQKMGTFNCFLHYHKIGRHTIPNIRGNYLRNEIDRAQRTVDRLKRELRNAKDAKDKVRERRLSVDFKKAFDVLEELQNFDKAMEGIHNFRLQKTKLGKHPSWVNKAIAEVRDDGWKPIIDYGVRVNIEPLKEAKLLHKAANKVK